MRRPTYNPTRRSRNIGTGKQGHGQNNRLVIPKPVKPWAMYWEDLKNPVAIDAKINGSALTFLVEPTHPGFAHPCSVEDVYELLTLVPPEDIDELSLIIMRQPTRKQRILSEVWGRFLYFVELGEFSGSAVCIEAQQSIGSWSWRSSLTPDDKLELDRLRADGHRIEKNARGYQLHRDPIAMRSTALFRTLPHEIGHLVDWKRSELSVPTVSEEETDYLRRQFESRPSKQKEFFANRYALELLLRLREAGRAPFPPQGCPRTALRLGLLPEWFMNMPQREMPDADSGGAEPGGLSNSALHLTAAGGRFAPSGVRR